MNMGERGVSTLMVKDLNSRVILKELKRLKTATVRELAEATGLTVVTVKGIIDTLMDHDRVLAGDLEASRGGRPSRCYLFNEKAKLGLVIYARETGGRDSLCIRVVDLFGETVESLPPLFEPDWEGIKSAVKECLVRYPAIEAVSMGIPGIEEGGNIIVMDYPHLKDVPLGDLIRDTFRLAVLIENDVNAAVMGLPADDEAALVYLYFPEKYPPGGGIRIGKELLKGRRHFAGEVSLMPLDIKWGPELTASFDEFCTAVSRLIAGVSALINPDGVTLYGEFLTPRHMGAIENRLRDLLPERAVPEVSLATDFNTDFEKGLISGLLELLES
ncbi:MAG: ROK family protein [Spirochaetales bacterium]|nr:ROK family protein [Spirochaetales bacterium]